MSVRFIIGRSGSGKTRHCVEQVLAALAESAEGPPLILLVPEQATFQIERMLIEHPAHPQPGDAAAFGFHRARVLSFQRFARLIFNELGGPSDPPISPLAKQMALRAVLAPLRAQLPTFAASLDRPGFLAGLARLFREFHQYEVDSARLRERAAAEPRDRLKRKLLELADAFEVFNDYLRRARFTDPDAALTAAADRLSRSQLAGDSLVWVDGFAGFTPQERTFLAELAVVARHVHIALIGDAEEFHGAAGVAAGGLFRRTRQTHAQLCRTFAGKGVGIDPPLELSGIHRFPTDSPLATIEQEMFRIGSSQACRSGRAVTGKSQTGQAESIILLVEAPDRRAEVRAAVNHIRDLIATFNYRYRDIAVILRNLDEYWQFIVEAFSDAGIPFFIDRREPVGHHPLVELVRSAVGAVVRRLDTRDVIAFLKTDLADRSAATQSPESPQPSVSVIFRDAVDRLENYALEFGLSGAAWLNPDKWRFHERAAIGDDELADNKVAEFDAIVRAARDGLGPLAEFYRKVADAGGTMAVRDWTAAIWRMLVRLDVSAKLAEWAKNDSPARAAVHDQAFDAVQSLLADLTMALGDQSMSSPEFAQVLDAGLSELTLGLVPPAMDQVLIGAIERSRHPHIRAALVLGMAERSFPRLAGVQSIITDDERETLAGDDPRSAIELAPSRNELLFDEDLLAYLALTRPAERLWVSYPIADDGGKPVNPSRYVARLVELLGLSLTRVRLAEQHDALAAVTTGELAGILASRRAMAIAGAEDATLAKRLRAIDPIALARSAAAISYTNKPTLSAELAARLFAPRGSVSASVTRLETFAACPFKHLARYGLELEPRRLIEMDALQLGRLYHELLRELFVKLSDSDGGVQWASRTPADLRKLAGELVAVARDRLDVPALEGGPADWLLAQAETVIADLLDAMHAASAASPAVRQVAAELSFGLGPDSDLPPLQIELQRGPKKAALLVRGLIDRVDMARNGALFVIDYKTGPTAIRWPHVAHGLSLQLQTYLLALRQHAARLTDLFAEPQASGTASRRTDAKASLRPAGGFFQRIAVSPPTAPPPASDDPPPEPADLLACYRRSGVFLIDSAKLLDASVAAGEKSVFIKFKLNKDGRPSGTGCDGVTAEQFARLLSLAESWMTRLGKAILAGQVAVEPYRLGNDSPCSRCEFSPACRMDFSYNRPRYLQTRRRNEILDETV